MNALERLKKILGLGFAASEEGVGPNPLDKRLFKMG